MCSVHVGMWSVYVCVEANVDFECHFFFRHYYLEAASMTGLEPTK